MLSARRFLGMAVTFAEISPAGDHLMVHQKLDHLTLVSAFLAVKPLCETGLSRKVKSSKLGLGEFGLLHQFGGPDGTHHIKIFRDDQRDFQFPFERSLNTSIRRDASLEDDGRKYFFPPADIIQIILCKKAGASNLLMLLMSEVIERLKTSRPASQPDCPRKLAP